MADAAIHCGPVQNKSGHQNSHWEIFLGPRGTLIEPSMPVPSVCVKNPDHLINHRRTTVNLLKEKRGKGKRRKREKEEKRKREKEKKRKRENGKREKEDTRTRWSL